MGQGQLINEGGRSVEGFAKTIDKAIYEIRNKFGELILTQFLSNLISVGVILVGVIILGIVAIIFSAANVFGSGGSGIAVFSIILCYVLFICLIIVAIDIGKGASMILIDKNSMGQKIDSTAAIGASFKKISSYLGYALIEIAFLVPIIAIVLLLGIIFINNALLWPILITLDKIDVDSIGGIFLICLIMLAIILVIYLLIMAYQTFFLYGIAAIALDGLGPIKAFKKNLHYLKGQYIKTVKHVIGFMWGIIGINWGLMMIVGTVSSLLILLMGLGGNYTGSLVLSEGVAWVFQAINTLIISSIEPVVVMMLYKNQRDKKEGTDLKLKLQQLKEIQTSKETVV